MSTAQIYELPVIAQGMKAGLPSPQDKTISANVVDSIGHTPMIRLSRYLDLPNIDLIAKLEASNPGGSAKDRPARRMIEEGLKDGSINARTTIIESSSGNMGIGLAQICRYHGLRFICVVDPNAQAQNVAIIRALGAEVRLVTKPLEGDFLAARLALVQEIDDTLGGAFDYLFVATSSTGTARGCRDYLAKRGRHTAVVAVDAAGSILFNGNAGPRKISGMGAGTLPDLARDQQFDDVVRVSDIRCVAGCRRAAAREALLVGGSGGGVLEAVRQMQSELVGKTVAVILHDSGVRYLETVFNDAWVEKELGCSADDLHTMANSRF